MNNTHLVELEGTWEEIMAHTSELEGRRVKLVILAKEENSEAESTELASEAPEFSTGRSLLKYAGTWDGDDLPELLREVYENPSQAKF